MHERHAPPQDVLQQTPSAQKPDEHSAPTPHGNPFILGPHIPFTHLRPATQFASLLQVEKQAFVAALHKYGAQTVDADSLHRPAPSHVLMPMIAPESHVPALHVVPGTWLRHFPVPSQVPSRPQVDLSWPTH